MKGHILQPTSTIGPAFEDLYHVDDLGGWGVGILPYLGNIGMCHCEGYGFQSVYSRIGYINQRVWV